MSTKNSHDVGIERPNGGPRESYSLVLPPKDYRLIVDAQEAAEGRLPAREHVTHLAETAARARRTSIAPAAGTGDEPSWAGETDVEFGRLRDLAAAGAEGADWFCRRVYEVYRHDLLRYIKDKLSGKGDPQDYLHDVFESVVKSGHRLMLHETPVALLRTIALNKIIDGSRKTRVAKKYTQSEVRNAKAYGLQEAQLDEGMSVSRAESIIVGLPPEERTAIIDAINGTRLKQTGKKLGVSVATASRRLRTAREKLRDALA